MFIRPNLLLGLTTQGLLLFLLCSCANVGPQSISVSRTAYAKAIDQTENEQLLLSIIKGRYGETASLLAVNAVAANISFRSEAGIEAGFGSNNIRGENLLIGGLVYEENPTITYSPVQGQKYIRQLASPVPLDLLMLTVRSTPFAGSTLTLLVSRANNLRNPGFLAGPSNKPNQGFKRFVELFTHLHSVGVLELVKNPNEGITANVLIGGYSPGYTAEVHELLSLLDLSMPEDQTIAIIIPIYFGVNFDKSWGLGITTRTTLELIEAIKASIDVPEEHIQAGLSLSYPPLGLMGEGLKIKTSKTKPNASSLAVPYRGYWFFIDDTDQATKAFFIALRTLWTISIDVAVDPSDVPLMTIPVSQ